MAAQSVVQCYEQPAVDPIQPRSVLFPLQPPPPAGAISVDVPSEDTPRFLRGLYPSCHLARYPHSLKP